MKIIKNESGQSLLEIVASLVIISIVLILFAQVFIQNNKTANYNNEKLIVINLADAYLERLKVEGLEEDNSISNVEDYFSDYPKKIKLTNDPNSSEYEVKISASSNSSTITNAITTETQQNKINVVVTVTSGKTFDNNRKIISKTEGYVQIEKK